jgi:hypothetical protein
MQTGLFDDTNLLRIEYQESLKCLKWGQAFKTLRQLAEALQARRDLSPKIRAFETFMQMVEERRGAIEKLADLAAELTDIEPLNPLSTDFPYIRQGLMEEIADLLPEDPFDYITPRLHPAEVFLELSCFDRAINAVALYIEHKGEDALLRQVQGLAYFRQEEKGMARRSLSLALFHDPCCCREAYLFPEEVRRELKDLQESSADPETAWLALPFELWKKKMIPIADDAAFEIHLKGLTDGAHPLTDPDPKNRRLHFLHLLYLAELSRLRGEDADQKSALRLRMKEIDKDQLDAYMTHLHNTES